MGGGETSCRLFAGKMRGFDELMCLYELLLLMVKLLLPNGFSRFFIIQGCLFSPQNMLVVTANDDS